MYVCINLTSYELYIHNCTKYLLNIINYCYNSLETIGKIAITNTKSFFRNE